MTELSIGDRRPRVVHVQETEGGTDFSFNFALVDFTTLRVAVSGTILDATGYGLQSNTTLPAASGAVSLVTTPPLGALVTIWREVPVERTTDFIEDGAFRSSSLNAELDRFAMMLQQIEQRLGDTLRCRPDDPDRNLTLPVREERAGSRLMFSSDGSIFEKTTPAVGSASADDALASANTADQFASNAEAAVQAISNAASADNNLADLDNVAAARSNLGIYRTATITQIATAAKRVDLIARAAAGWNAFRVATLDGVSTQEMVDGVIDTLTDLDGIDAASSIGYAHVPAQSRIDNVARIVTTIAATQWPGSSGSLANSTDGVYTWKKYHGASNNGAYQSASPSNGYTDYTGETRFGWQWGGNANAYGNHMYLDGTDHLIDFDTATEFAIRFGLRIRGDSQSGGRFVQFKLMPNDDYYMAVYWRNASESSGSLTGEGYLGSVGAASNPLISDGASFWGHNQWHDYELRFKNLDPQTFTYDIEILVDGVEQLSKTGMVFYGTSEPRPTPTTLLGFGKHTDNQSGEYAEVDKFEVDVVDSTQGSAMTLVSAGVTAAAQPNNATLLIWHDGNGDDLLDGENLISRSAAFDHADWTRSGVSVDVNPASDPDGGMGAARLVEDTGNTNHAVFRLPSVEANRTYTISVHAKAAGRTQLRLLWGDSTTTSFGHATFDLSAGAVGAVTMVGAASGFEASILDVGGGWYRCVLTGTVDDISTQGQWSANLSSAGSTAYLGDGESGIDLWGAQLEKAAAVGPYQETNSLPTGSGIVLERDLVLSVSRDDGANWTEGAPVRSGSHDNLTTIVTTEVDLSSQPGGAEMRWRIETPGRRRQSIHGVCLQWR